MRNKPNYKGYCLHIKEWDKLGISYSLNDLLELHIKYHLPFPKNAIIDSRIRRDDIVTKLTYKWRKAENYYLESGSDSLKEKLLKIQDRLHLNEPEIDLLEILCNNLGI